MVDTITRRELFFLEQYREMPTATVPPVRDLTRFQLEKAMEIADMTVGVMTIEGLPRSGKTLFGTMIAWKIKEYFFDMILGEIHRRNVITDYHPRKAFGDYTFFDTDFLEADLRRVKDLAKKNTDSSWDSPEGERLRSLLYRAVLVLDEAYRHLDRRRGMDPVGLYLLDIIKQFGHYGLFLMLIAHDRFELDDRVEKFITHEAKCSWEVYRPGVCDVSVYNRYTSEKKGFSITAANWYPLFHSWNPITPRQRGKITV